MHQNTYYKEIKNKLLDNEAVMIAKDYSKERHRLITYYEVGKLLSEAGKHYGENIIGEYSEKLERDIGKKYNKSTLFKIRKFYLIFSHEKVAPLVPQLSWSHCLALIPLKNINEINYYINQINDYNLSKRQLEVKIKNKEYERLPESTKKKLINKEELGITDNIKNPIIIKDNDSYKDFSEKILHNLILDDISNFLKELGEGFSYIDHEYKIRFGDNYNYIDLLLFNIEFNCYVVVELKITELKKEHIGQIKLYMNYIDKHVKNINQDKTIGIIICKKNNRYVIEYSSDERIICKEYILI